MNDMTPAEAVEHLTGTHYTSPAFRRALDGGDWNNIWPEIDGDGNLTGRLIGSGEDGYANVDDDAMIDLDVAKASGWTIDDGYATPPEPVLIEAAIENETIRDHGGIDEFAGLRHEAMEEACAAYRTAAINALADDSRAGRLDVDGPRGPRRLHSQWCGAHWGYTAGALATMSRTLTASEKAALDAAHDAGVAAARSVIEKADAAVAAQWKPTHRITLDDGTTYEVMLCDGPAYQQIEWEAGDAADFEYWGEGWCFQGQPFAGKVEKIA